MRSRRIVAIAAKEVRSVGRDPAVFIVMLAMPLVLILFVKNGLQPLVPSKGAVVRTSGSDFAVPAFTLMFAFYQIGFLGFAVTNEHGWCTWARLRIAARPTEILLGKTVPYAVISLAQVGVLFTLGWSLLGMHVTGSIAALLLVVVAIVCVVIGFGFAVVSFCKTAQQVAAFGNLGSILLAAVGGAVLPFEALPGWAQAVSPATPHYWAMRAFRSILVEAGGVADVAPSLMVLVAMAAVLGGLGLVRFRFDDVKVANAIIS